MQYIEAPDQSRPQHKDRLFLAGGITSCPDWQHEAHQQLANLPITLYNPRRTNFDITDPTASEKQIRWEWERLRLASHILFWFPCETLCPIVLFELGAALERASQYPSPNPKLFIGCHPEYKRLQDVQIQTNLVLGITTIHTSLDNLINAVQNSFK